MQQRREKEQSEASSMSNSLRVLGAVLGPDECILNVEIIDPYGETIGTAYGEKNARLFAGAEEAFELVKRLVENNLDPEDYKCAQKLIDRVENSPALECDGLTAQELLDDVVWGGKKHDHKRN